MFLYWVIKHKFIQLNHVKQILIIKDSKSKITQLPEENIISSDSNSHTDFFENNESDDENEDDNMDNPVDLKMLFKSVLKVNIT